MTHGNGSFKQFTAYLKEKTRIFAVCVSHRAMGRGAALIIVWQDVAARSLRPHTAIAIVRRASASPQHDATAAAPPDLATDQGCPW